MLRGQIAGSERPAGQTDEEEPKKLRRCMSLPWTDCRYI